MPTLLRAHGLRFMIFVDDHPPPHVHVSGRGAARIAIREPHEVLTVKGMSKVDTVRARDTVKREQSLLIEAWTRIHGRPD